MIERNILFMPIDNGLPDFLADKQARAKSLMQAESIRKDLRLFAFKIWWTYSLIIVQESWKEDIFGNKKPHQVINILALISFSTNLRF